MTNVRELDSVKFYDSGIEWIGEIPENWNKVQLRYLCDITTGNKDTENRVVDGKYPFFVRSQTVERINSYSYDGEAILTAGDGVGVCKVWHHVNERFDFHQRVYMMHNFHNCYGRFLFYYLKENFIHEVLKLSAKSTVDSLRRPMFLSFPVVIPSLAAQTTIASFLDEKTALIDELIAKKQRMIELLEEQRQATINQAVTKGLDPTVPMKESGIKWIGEIPVDWEVVKLKYCIDFKEGPGIMAVDFTSQGIPLIRISGMKSEYVTLQDCNYLSEEKVESTWNSYKLKKGDIVISASASTDLVAEVSSSDVEGAVPYTGLIRLRPKNDLLISDFIKLIPKSNYYFDQIEVQKSGSIIQHYGPTHLSRIVIVKPPVQDQVVIVDYIKIFKEAVDGEIKILRSSVIRLKEYKSSLIFNAVTGKLPIHG